MLNFLFLKICNSCKNKLFKGEDILCVCCRYNLFLVCFYCINNDSMKNIFYGRFLLENVIVLVMF